MQGKYKCVIIIPKTFGHIFLVDGSFTIKVIYGFLPYLPTNNVLLLSRESFDKRLACYVSTKKSVIKLETRLSIYQILA